MTGVKATVRRIELPNGPRATMRRLRKDGRYALLESSMPLQRLGEWSYIAGPCLATLRTDALGTTLESGSGEVSTWSNPLEALSALAVGNAVEVDGDPPAGMRFLGGWVGVLGYDLLRSRHLGARRRDAKHEDQPFQWWMAVDQVLAFHHPTEQWWHATTTGRADAWPWTSDLSRGRWMRTLEKARQPPPACARWSAGTPTHSMDQAQYEEGVSTIRRHIAQGDVLQVNLTRREQADFAGDAWSMYEELAQVNPAPFAAFIEAADFTIASCSPERFLCRRGDDVEVRPIKGTQTRGKDATEDEQQRARLAGSEKDRAENLMIVDLMRNDLGRVALTGSVRVPELFSIEPYAGVWQMVSAVVASVPTALKNADLIRACWPPGSMTGAPKAKAIEIIDALEPVERGFYAGSIGYLDASGDMDLSVVIRTAIVAGGRVSIQLGAGIVSDSLPSSEWQETVAKGALLNQVLGAARSPAAKVAP